MTQTSLLDALESPEELRQDLRKYRRLWTVTYRDGMRELVRVVRINCGPATQTLPDLEDVTERVARACELRTVNGRILAVSGGIAPCHQIKLHLTRTLSTHDQPYKAEVTEL